MIRPRTPSNKRKIYKRINQKMYQTREKDGQSNLWSNHKSIRPYIKRSLRKRFWSLSTNPLRKLSTRRFPPKRNPKTSSQSSSRSMSRGRSMNPTIQNPGWMRWLAAIKTLSWFWKTNQSIPFKPTSHSKFNKSSNFNKEILLRKSSLEKHDKSN